MRLVTPEMATTMIIGALTNRASTADCPSTSAPTIESACPMEAGVRSPVSRSRSKASSRMSASSTDGSGTPSRAFAMLMSSGVGISS